MFGEKSISKKMNLLYYLEVFENEVTVTQLTDFLEISRITLKKYITEVNELGSDYEIFIKNNQVILKSDHRENGIVLSKKVIADSVNVRLLITIMYKGFSLSQLSERLFISKSTLIYKIGQINEYFKSHHLDIKISLLETYRIIGNEKEIRNFFNVLLLEVEYFPIYKNNYLIFSEFRRYLEKKRNEINLWNDSLKIDTCMFVSTVRSAQGFYLYESLEEISEDMLVEIEYAYYKISKIMPFVHFIQKKFECRMNLLFFANIIPADYLMSIIYLRSEPLPYKDIGEKSETLLKSYIEKYEISLSEKTIQSYCKLLTRHIFFVEPINQVMLRDFEIHFRQLKKISDEKTLFLYENLKKSGVIPYDVESLYYEIAIYFIVSFTEIRKDFFSVSVVNSLNVLLYSSKNLIFSELIEYIIKDRYSYNFPITIDHLNIFYDPYNVDDYDIIISDIYLDKFEKKYLFLPMTPNEDFWQSFEQFLH